MREEFPEGARLDQGCNISDRRELGEVAVPEARGKKKGPLNSGGTSIREQGRLKRSHTAGRPSGETAQRKKSWSELFQKKRPAGIARTGRKKKRSRRSEAFVLGGDSQTVFLSSPRKEE